MAFMNVTLVYPDYTMQRPFSRPKVLRVEKGGWYNEGLAALSAGLKQKGAHVSLLHYRAPIDEQTFKEKLKRTDPDIVAFTVRTSALELATTWSKWAKEAVEKPVLWGGYHPTLAPEECLRVPFVDAVVRGDGDLVIYTACEALANSHGLENVLSLSYRENGNFISNPTASLVWNLDELPMPDFSIFNYKELISTKTNVALGMLSRGCPYNCTYCSNRAFRSVYPNPEHYHRSRSPEGAMEYIEQLRSVYPEVKEFRFLDNVFGLNMQWLEQFTKLYKRHVNLPFSCDERVELLTDDRVKLLKEAGCKQVYLGVESGNETLRKLVLERTMSNELLKKGLDRLHDNGIRAFAFNMVGLPGEDKQMALSTVKLNATLKVDDSIVSVFSPYPSTILYKISVEKGYVKLPIDYTQFTFLDQPNFSKEEVAFFAVYFGFLRRFYRSHGENSGLSKMMDNIILSPKLRIRFLISIGESYMFAWEDLKSYVRMHMPGVFKAAKRVLRR